jgi:hypothetical protein
MGRALLVAGVALTIGLAGCAKEQPRPQAQTQPSKESAGPPPPAGSPLAKIHEGMTEMEVGSILGPPTGSKAYITGKAFIPFYYGPDQSRFVAYYKGKGRIIFSGGNQWGAGRGKVIRIEYDPSEPGVAH